MLSVRPPNTQESNINKKQTKRARNKAGLHESKLKNEHPKIINTSKPKPLQASTNTIHTHQKAPQSAIIPEGKKLVDDIDLCKKPVQQNEKTPNLKNTKSPSDENDCSDFVKNAYDPLKEICGLDEELFQRVMKLELADDGLPEFKSDEPFDF